MSSDENEALRELYAQSMGRRSAASRAGCVSEERLLAVAKGEAPRRERLTVLHHVAQCADCRVEFDLLRAATGEWPRARRRVPVRTLVASFVVMVALAVALWLMTCALVAPHRIDAEPLISTED